MLTRRNSSQTKHVRATEVTWEANMKVYWSTTRKRSKGAAAAAAASVCIAIAAPQGAEAQDKIKVGFLEDQTGEIAPFTLPKVRAAQLTVDEINASGGILGRQLELIMYDPQFDNAKFQEFARRLLESD